MRAKKRTAAVWTSSLVPPLVPALLFIVVAASSHAASDAAGSSADSRITVTDVAGDVDVTMAGNAQAVSADSIVLLPARIVTGHDGTLGLTQAGTRISVANDTDVEIPAEAVDGNLVARLVQHSGNVFYDVAPRDVGKLRVETPFLVAVIKGTQFNVAVEEDGTTISLFEGHLEIRMPDDSDVVELNAGEIAIRSLIDDSIRIIGMDDLRVAVPPPPAPPAARDDAAAASAAAPAQGSVAAGEAVIASANDAAVAVDARDESFIAARPPQESTASGTALVRGIQLDVDLPLIMEQPHLGFGREEHPGLGAERGNGGRSVELPVEIGLGTRLDVGAPSVDIGLDIGADLGGPADVGADAGLDLGAALDVVPDVGLDLGTVADTGADLSVDNGPIDLTVDAGVDGVDLNIDIDLPGPVDLALDLDRGRDKPVHKPRGLLGALP